MSLSLPFYILPGVTEHEFEEKDSLFSRMSKVRTFTVREESATFFPLTHFGVGENFVFRKEKPFNLK